MHCFAGLHGTLTSRAALPTLEEAWKRVEKRINHHRLSLLRFENGHVLGAGRLAVGQGGIPTVCALPMGIPCKKKPEAGFQVQRRRNFYLFALELLFLATFGFGCGGQSKPSGLAAQPPPFDTAAGEGNIVGHAPLTAYTTTALETFYDQTICPAAILSQDCATNQANLDTGEFGHFNLAANPIAGNSLGIKQVDAIKIDYTAVNVDRSPVTVSGGVAIPELAPASLKGLILYFHGTTTERSNVPSNFAAAPDPSNATDGILMAALWASQGYIVVMPDYIGLGDDTTHSHPYVVYPTQNAQAGLAMVSAARTLLAQSYQVTGLLPLYIAGYSEGGAYALQAGHLMQDNENYSSQLNVHLKKVVPLSGFFDLSGTGLTYLFDNISDTNNPWHSLNWQTSELSKPFLTAYLALSFAGYANISPTSILADHFYLGSYSDNDCWFLSTNGANLTDIYFTDAQISGYDTAVLAAADCQALATGWSNPPTNYSNAITPLLTGTYANALMRKDTSNPLYAQLMDADTYDFAPNFPVTLVSLEQDSVVTRTNSDVAYQYFIQHGSKDLYQEELIPNGYFFAAGQLGDAEVDHTTELPFLSVLLLNEFNTTTQ